ncbi:MAG: hypothetical protein E6Q97_17070 [Desulfurellales bacterium]|nr:MAG: hypothetical protein E6Q97_17070 [Desulfurellales bacterium]
MGIFKDDELTTAREEQLRQQFNLSEPVNAAPIPIPGTGVVLTQTPAAAEFQPDWSQEGLESQQALAAGEPLPPPPRQTVSFERGTGLPEGPARTEQPAPATEPLPPPPSPGPAGPPTDPFSQSAQALERRRLGIPEDVSGDFRVQQQLDAQAAAEDRRGYNAQAAQEREAAEAERQRIAEEEAVWRQRKLQATEEALKANRARLDALSKESVSDPDKFWKDHWAGPVFGRIGAAIAIGLATFGGQGQTAYKMISDGINRDIDAQKARWEAKAQLAKKHGDADALQLKAYDDRLHDLEHMRTVGLQASAQRLKDMAAAMGDSERQRHADIAVAALQDESARNAAKQEAAVLQSIQRRLDAQRKAAAAQDPYAKAMQQGYQDALRERIRAAAGGRPVQGRGPGEMADPKQVAKISDQLSKSQRQIEAIDKVAERWSGYAPDAASQKLITAYMSDPTRSSVGTRLAEFVVDDKKKVEAMEFAKDIGDVASYGLGEFGAALTKLEKDTGLNRARLELALRNIKDQKASKEDVKAATALIPHMKDMKRVLLQQAYVKGSPAAQAAASGNMSAAEKRAREEAGD